jgi:hypothetical protein
MKVLIHKIATCFILILSVSEGNAQDKRQLKINFETGYQFWENQSYYLGIGESLKKTLNCKFIDYYNIHGSLYYEKFIKDDSLKNDYTLTSRIAFEFKYFLVGAITRNFNLLQEQKFRIDIAPEVGIGYKYVWITYSRSLLIYQQENIPVSSNNFKVYLVIPFFNKQI